MLVIFPVRIIFRIQLFVVIARCTLIRLQTRRDVANNPDLWTSLVLIHTSENMRSHRHTRVGKVLKIPHPFCHSVATLMAYSNPSFSKHTNGVERITPYIITARRWCWSCLRYKTPLKHFRFDPIDCGDLRLILIVRFYLRRPTNRLHFVVGPILHVVLSYPILSRSSRAESVVIEWITNLRMDKMGVFLYTHTDTLLDNYSHTHFQIPSRPGKQFVSGWLSLRVSGTTHGLFPSLTTFPFKPPIGHRP